MPIVLSSVNLQLTPEELIKRKIRAIYYSERPSKDWYVLLNPQDQKGTHVNIIENGSAKGFAFHWVVPGQCSRKITCKLLCVWHGVTITRLRGLIWNYFCFRSHSHSSNTDSTILAASGPEVRSCPANVILRSLVLSCTFSIWQTLFPTVFMIKAEAKLPPHLISCLYMASSIM